eukprot:928482-Heterocapsa_arctica.AAC.1
MVAAMGDDSGVAAGAAGAAEAAEAVGGGMAAYVAPPPPAAAGGCCPCRSSPPSLRAFGTCSSSRRLLSESLSLNFSSSSSFPSILRRQCGSWALVGAGP